MLGFQSQLPTTMAEYHFDDVDDVEDYLTLLNSLGNYVDSLLTFENQKADAGYGMCRSALETSIEDCQSFIESPETNLLIEVFPEKLNDLNLSEEEREEKEEDSSFVEGDELDVEELVRNELIVQWPIRVLCKDDCKGICSRCGANLNIQTCDCDTTGLDPRMAAIKDIFSKFKEV